MVISLFIEALLGVAPCLLAVLKADEEIILRNKGWEGVCRVKAIHKFFFKVLTFKDIFCPCVSEM
jgi:hypothetical protein